MYAVKYDYLSADHYTHTTGQKLTGVGVIAALVLLGWIGWQPGNNQLTPVIPGAAQPAPVFKLPAMAAELASVKAECEGDGSIIRNLASTGGISRQQVFKGEKLFIVVKKETDGCITFLSSALARRFQEGDEAEIRTRLIRVRYAVNAFVTWFDEIQPRTPGAFTSLDSILSFLSAWCAEAGRTNSEALWMLRDDLEKCRLRNWNGLDH
jgi:hypothetical protein